MSWHTKRSLLSFFALYRDAVPIKRGQRLELRLRDRQPPLQVEAARLRRVLCRAGTPRLRPRTARLRAARGGGDWNHTNSINYNAKLDLITISVRTFNELWVIDHSTTTEEAASHEGGERGRGGDLLYRWGNPAAYGRGGRRDMRLYGQHDVQWIEEGFPGGGNLLIFNNGGRDGREYSTVDEIITPFNKEAVYEIEEGEAFGPEKMHWSYGEKESERFSSSFISGAQRLTNGNTLICSGADGRLFEVTAQKEIVWEYINPFFDEGITPAGRRGPNRRQGGGPRGDGPPGRDRGQGGPGGRRGGGRPGGVSLGTSGVSARRRLACLRVSSVLFTT